MNCREYIKADFTYIQSLLHELGYSITKEDLLTNITELQQRGGVIFVAEMDNQLVGCICAMIDARLAEGVYGEIVSLVVSERYRGIGVGKHLVALSEEWLCQRVTKIRVRANEVRTGAHSFYAKLGYKEVKKQKVFLKIIEHH